MLSEDAARTTGAAVLAGGLWNMASRGIPQIYLLVVSVSAARFLGPERFGRQSFIAFVAISATMLLTGGLPTAVARYVGDALGRRSPAAVHGLVRLAWQVSLPAALAGAAVLIGIGLGGGDPRAAWLLAGAVAAFGILNKVPNSVLVGAQRWRAASAAGLALGTVSMAATVAVLAAGGGITGMFAVEAAAAVATLAVLGWLAGRVRRELEARPGPAADLRREAVQYTLVASVGVVMTFVVWRRSELFFLERFSSETQVALYSIAFAAVAAPVVLFQGITGAILPAVATLHGAGELERIRAGFSRSLRLLLVLALPLTALGLALGPAVLRLVYGSEFHGVGPVVLIMLGLTPVLPVVDLSAVLLAGLGRVWFPVIAGAAASAVNIGLDLVLIPHLDAVGAAVANTFGQLALGVPVVVYACRILGGVRWGTAALARTVLASAGAGLAALAGVVVIDGIGGILLGAALGGIALAALAPSLRVLPGEDAVWLQATAGRLLGGRVGRAIRACSPSEAAP